MVYARARIHSDGLRKKKMLATIYMYSYIYMTYAYLNRCVYNKRRFFEFVTSFDGRFDFFFSKTDCFVVYVVKPTAAVVMSSELCTDRVNDRRSTYMCIVYAIIQLKRMQSFCSRCSHFGAKKKKPIAIIITF